MSKEARFPFTLDKAERWPLRSKPVTANAGSRPPSSTRSQRIVIGAAILLFALISAYLALIIITRVDNVFLPGRQVTLPGGVGNVLPGVDSKGVSGGNDPINILVMGLDRRPSEGVEPTRSDTLFVLRVDPQTDSAAILGIPRDLMVDIPLEGGGSYQDRVNTVYVQGELTGYPGGGIGLMKEVLENEPFGISIDKYVIVDFEGFESLIDALGGVDVDVPDEVYDPYYSETELPGDYLPQHFLPGNQHMDGVTALAYSRIRFSSDDLDRIQRQQRVIFAAIDKAVAKEGWKIVGLTRLSPVFPFTLLNYAFGLTKVQLRHYMLASWIGMMPGTIMYVYIGSLAKAASGERTRTTGEWVLYGVGLLATVVVTVVVTRLAKKALDKRATR